MVVCEATVPDVCLTIYVMNTIYFQGPPIVTVRHVMGCNKWLCEATVPDIGLTVYVMDTIYPQSNQGF